MNTTTPQQHTEKLTHEILNRIEREDITPVSKTIFTLKNILFWTLWIVTATLGAFAVAVLIFTELNIGWEFYDMTHRNAFTFFVHSLPYLWILLLSGLILLGIYNVRHTKKGYRYSLFTVVLVSVCGSVLGGFVFHSYGVGGMLDEGFGRFMPMYVPARGEREAFWRQPDKGLYTGTIDSLDIEQANITIKSADGITYVFNTAFVPQKQLIELSQNAKVRIMATSSGEGDSLIACRIGEWEAHGALTVGDMHERKQMFRNVFENIEERIENEIETEITNPCESLKPRNGLGRIPPPMPLDPEIKE